jgi:SAM-dependent methyltransferase
VKNNFAYTGCDNLEVMKVAKNYNKFLLNLIEGHGDKLKNCKVLDFGAGSGTYADLLKDKDVSPDCLEPDAVLRKKLNKKGYRTHKDVEDLPRAYYDIVYSFNVFEHIEDDLGVADKMLNSLKPGGVLVIYVPAFQVLYSSMDKKVEHIRRYRLDRLRKIANNNDLTILRLHYCDPIGFFAALFYKYFGNKDGSLSEGAIKFYDKLIFPFSRLLEYVTRPLFGKNAVLVAKK